MQLPTYKPVEKLKLKHCQYMDCGREFFGRPIQKYCDFHTDPHNRKRIRPKPEHPSVKNQVFTHHFHNKTDLEFTCALEGCDKLFHVDVYPKQYIYPKYCDEHRSEFKRFNFLRNRRLKIAC